MENKIRSEGIKKAISILMKRTLLIFTTLLLILAGVLGALRLFVGGGEDTWICDQGVWVKHGVPNAPKPEGSCGP